MSDRKILTISLPEDVYNQLVKLTTERCINRSAFVSNIIRVYLKVMEKEDQNNG